MNLGTQQSSTYFKFFSQALLWGDQKPLDVVTMLVQPHIGPQIAQDLLLQVPGNDC